MALFRRHHIQDIRHEASRISLAFGISRQYAPRCVHFRPAANDEPLLHGTDRPAQAILPVAETRRLQTCLSIVNLLATIASKPHLYAKSASFIPFTRLLRDMLAKIVWLA